MTEIPSIPDESTSFDVTKEFEKLREKTPNDLAKSFVEGGIWLAKQKDPVRQFERIATGEFRRTTLQRKLAQQQFQESVNQGHPDYGKMFDIFMGLSIYRVSPETYMEAIIRHLASDLPLIEKESRLKHDLISLIEKSASKESISLYTNSLKNFDFTVLNTRSEYKKILSTIKLTRNGIPLNKLPKSFKQNPTEKPEKKGSQPNPSS